MRKRQRIVATCFDERGRKLSKAVNSYVKSHPAQRFFAIKAGRPDAIFLHAEMAAMLKAKHPIHRLVVERYTNGKPALAAPCSVCMKAIEHFNVKVLEYTK